MSQFLDRFCSVLAALLVLSVTAHAQVGVGESLLFTVDTRYGGNEGTGASSFFAVDTRFSGSSGEEFSDLFTVETLGATTGTAVISGAVTDSMGTGLGGATVSLLRSSVTLRQGATDVAGNYSLSSLPAGTYDVRAQMPNYVSSVRYGATVADGRTFLQNFSLAPLPGAPVVLATNRVPEQPAALATAELKRFTNGHLMTVAGTNGIDRNMPAVICTHGWNSDSDGWTTNMLGKMVAGGVTGANLLAWDWRTNAGTGPLLSLALSRTPGEGRKLGQALAAVLGTNYQQGLHFIGHSLGTLVNATAANYLHNKTGGAFDWHKTQMTLLDNAELANVEGKLASLAYSVEGFGSVLGLGDALYVGWVSPLPEQRVWADNYISLIGTYHSEAVNASLLQHLGYSELVNPLGWLFDSHGYACEWYANTAQNPSSSQLGNRYSFERLGTGAQFPSPWPYPVGTLFAQISSDDYSLVNVLDVPKYLADQGPELGASVLDGLSKLADTGQKIGNVVVNVVESTVSSVEAGASQVISLPIASLQAVLTSTSGVQGPAADAVALQGERGPLGPGGYTNSPSAVWLPIQVPTDAALFFFDFTFNGDSAQDLLSASVAGTNVFTLEAQDMPTGQVLSSGPIDVSALAGQTVELFFGLLGGTSTNGVVSIEAMRFYQIARPLVAAEQSGTNIVVSWPASAVGYALESQAALGAANWATVSNAPVLAGMRQYVTNGIGAESRFYRLRRN